MTDPFLCADHGRIPSRGDFRGKMTAVLLICAVMLLGQVTPAQAEDTKSDALIRLTGMSAKETTRAPWGDETTQTFLIVDQLDPDGPAARAGFRSGDYLNLIGWTSHDSLDAFSRTLAGAEAQKAAVLSLQVPGEYTAHRATLVVFADSPSGALIDLPRGDEQDGRRILASSPYQSLSVTQDGWCAEHVEVKDAQGVNSLQQVIYDRAVIDAALAAIRSECSMARTVSIRVTSAQVDAPIHVWQIEIDGPWERVGLDGLEPGNSVLETRQIALAGAPACDRLAAHPRDPQRRYGLEGVIAIQDIDAAFEACLSAVDADPEDAVSRFHLGRVLHANGLMSEAADMLRVAADQGHGGAMDLLGQMYALGEGVEPDAQEAAALFQEAAAAGFTQAPAPRSGVIDLTGVTLPDGIREVFELAGGMMMAMRPDFAQLGFSVPTAYLEPDLRAYIIHVFAEVTSLCGSEESLADIEAAAGYLPQPDLDHARFLFAEHLPTLLPAILSGLPADHANSTVGSRASAAALVGRYDCLSPQIRQFAMSAAEMALR